MSINEVISEAKKHMSNFEDISEPLIPMPVIDPLNVCDLLAVFCGAAGFLSLGYAMGLVH